MWCAARHCAFESHPLRHNIFVKEVNLFGDWLLSLYKANLIKISYPIYRMRGGLMFEKLLSYEMLLKCELITINLYNEYLNELFLQYPENGLLLELQWCSDKSKEKMDIVLEYFRKVEIDYDLFGNYLIDELKPIYKNMDIESFTEKIYLLWNQLSHSIAQKEPFWSLSFAGEPLSWGDERQARELYEKTFQYYENDK